MRALALHHLLDDASQFPPGNLELAPAWEAHKRWRSSAHAYLVGRFLVPAERSAALAELIVARIGSIELVGTPEDATEWSEQAPQALIFVEQQPVQELAKIRQRDPKTGAKLRCGGLKAAAFPTTEAVASFVHACVTLDVPFKATAGLHQPFRHWDAEIGVFHHGFLNLWSATALAAQGREPPQLNEVLEIEDPGTWRALGIKTEALEHARRWFTAFGTCSIAEPLDGLAAAGLADA